MTLGELSAFDQTMERDNEISVCAISSHSQNKQEKT